MCNGTVSESGGMSRFVPDCYKNQKTCNKTVDNFAHESQFVFNCYKTQNNA